MSVALTSQPVVFQALLNSELFCEATGSLDSEFWKALYLPSLLVCPSYVDLSRAPSEDGVPAAEEAMEATEEDQESPGQDTSQPGIYTEHVFTDPLGTESSGASAGNDNQRWVRPSILSLLIYIQIWKGTHPWLGSLPGSLIRTGTIQSQQVARRIWQKKRPSGWAAHCPPCGWGLRTAGEHLATCTIHISFMATDFKKDNKDLNLPAFILKDWILKVFEKVKSLNIWNIILNKMAKWVLYIMSLYTTMNLYIYEYVSWALATLKPSRVRHSLPCL